MDFAILLMCLIQLLLATLCVSSWHQLRKAKLELRELKESFARSDDLTR
jgi:hypothetical protein